MIVSQNVLISKSDLCHKPLDAAARRSSFWTAPCNYHVCPFGLYHTLHYPAAAVPLFMGPGHQVQVAFEYCELTYVA